MRYSLDTSVLVEAYRRHYPWDVFPALWDRLDELIDEGHLKATEEVRVELERKDDALLEWARSREHLFIPLDELIQRDVAVVLKEHPKLIDTRDNRSGADPWVIALAMVNGAVVVTGELPNNNRKRPHIPDVCHDLQIEWLDLLGLVRAEGWRF